MPALAPALMVQGTASSVGKSMLVTALCRYFARHGIRVAPFKAQNMSLNAAVSSEGLEIGRAQAVQAAAAFLPATVDMNPILIKPESDQRAQLVVEGRVAGQLHASGYGRDRARLAPVVANALQRLRERHELVLIEGAGSPAEINLQASDIVNMHVARLADAPVLLVGDIDRGGVFAALVGTLALLPPEDRARVAALVINKFRGNLDLLMPGIDMLVERAGVPVLGVVPYLRDMRLPREDSEGLHEERAGFARGAIDIAVIALPHMSNHDDFEPLAHEPGAALRFVRDPAELGQPALVVLPGSKCTIDDLHWLRTRGFDSALERRAAQGQLVLGICGGCQMLGERLEDPDGIESAQRTVAGLGLLPIRTRFGRDKITANVRAQVATPAFVSAGVAAGASVRGYEIHMGEVEQLPAGRAAFVITERNGAACAIADGAVNAAGNVVGTMLHGLFEAPQLRQGLLARLRSARDGGAEPEAAPQRAGDERDAHYDQLARAVIAHLDRDRLWALTGLRPKCDWPEPDR